MLKKELNTLITKFYEDVKKLEFSNPVTDIAEGTGYAKGNISSILNKKLQPSEQFLNKFYESFKNELSKVGIQEPQPTTNNIMETQDYRTKYEQLLERTNEQLSTALATVLTISKGVETSLNKAIKDQEGYHVSIAANQEVIFDALDEIRHAPAGQLSQTADNVRHERLLKISGKDSIGV
jgi:transcriptional regulator with XRE-family HTH domain